MPDNWGFVLSAYGIAAVTLTGYWWRLIRRTRELTRFKSRRERKSA